MQYTGPNYGLEDGMPARGEDGGSDADADFVNNDMASDGENSDEGSAGKVLPEEVQDVATTELANSRKSQGKAAKKGTTPQKPLKVSASEKETSKSRSKTINADSQHNSQSPVNPRKPKITSPSTVPKGRKGPAMPARKILSPESRVMDQNKGPKSNTSLVDLPKDLPQPMPCLVTTMATPSQNAVLSCGDHCRMTLLHTQTHKDHSSSTCPSAHPTNPSLINTTSGYHQPQHHMMPLGASQPQQALNTVSAVKQPANQNTPMES